MATSTRWGKKEVGVYADGARGFNGMLKKIVSLAINEGMPAPSDEDLIDFPDEVWDETEEWMNDNLAKDGYYFGSTEGGDWGYFRLEDE